MVLPSAAALLAAGGDIRMAGYACLRTCCRTGLLRVPMASRMQRCHGLGPRPLLHEDLASAVAHDGMARHGRRQVAVDCAQRVLEAALCLCLERLADRRLGVQPEKR